MIQFKIAPMPHQKVKAAVKKLSWFWIHAESKVVIIY